MEVVKNTIQQPQMPQQQVQPTKKGPFRWIAQRFLNVKNIKKNFQTVANNPYTGQKLMLNIYKYAYIFITVTIVIVFSWTIYRGFSTGSTVWGWVTNLVTLLLMFIIVGRIHTMYHAQKKIIEHYHQVPSATIDDHINQKGINLSQEVDDIIAKYGDIPTPPKKPVARPIDSRKLIIRPAVKPYKSNKEVFRPKVVKKVTETEYYSDERRYKQ